MEKSRFSLLLLEPGEIYFEDFSVQLQLGNDRDNLTGRLKLCSKSLVFEPHVVDKPLLKIMLQQCVVNSSGCMLSLQCNSFAEMLVDNVIAPYVFRHETKNLLFSLHYVSVEDCLSQILQLQRASTLPLPDQNSMVAAIEFSKKSRLKFDLNWLQDYHESVLLELDASKVSPLVVNPGRIVLTSSRMYFQPFNNADSYPVLKIMLDDISVVTRRRFLQRQVGLEFVFDNGPANHLYLAFKSESDRQQFYDTLLQRPLLKLKQSEPEIMTLKWQNGALSNYEYLLYVNSLADRSFNDLTQYPVFPWVISDYHSEKLDLENPQVFRDLTKPIGALNLERLEKLKKRREEMVPPKFLYGSHYSAPGFVLFYLIRKYPQYMLCLQNGRFDHPDRIFNSVSDVWRNVQSNMADFKEVIPEFYDTSTNGDFLVHSSNVQLGTRHDGRRIGDVCLPPWCRNAGDFVQKLREALESDHVSRTLPDWIDLVFGCKQRGKPAETFDNVFYHLCYEGAVDLDAISDWNERHALEVQIMEFGQIPKQVFKVPHPRKLKIEVPRLIPCLGACTRLSELSATDLAMHKESITGIASYEDVIISVGRDSVLKEFRKSTKQRIRSVTIATAGISACVILSDADTIILGTFDNRIIVYKLERSTIIDEIRTHEDAISCLCWNTNSSTLLSGSWDGSLLVWQDAVSEGSWSRLKSVPTTRFDREANVTCAALDRNGELAACGTEEGEVAVFQISSSIALLELNIHNSSVTAIDIVKNRLISCSKTGFHVHDLPSGLHIYSASSDFYIRSLAWFGDVMLLGSDCGTIQSWDFQNVVLLNSIKSSDSPVSCLGVSTCGQYIISGEGKTVVLRD